MEDLKKRNQDLYALIQLLATYGPSTMNEKELIEVTKAFHRCHKKFQIKPSFQAVTHLMFGVSSSEALRESLMRGDGDILSLANTSTLIGTSFLEGYFLKSYIEYRKSLKEELQWIRKFKQSRIRTREAYAELKQQLLKYQQEYDENIKTLESEKEKSLKLIHK